MFGLGDVDIFILGMVALLLFGNKLPAVMRSLGKTVAELKRNMDDMREQVRKSVEVPDAKDVPQDTATEEDSHSDITPEESSTADVSASSEKDGV